MVQGFGAVGVSKKYGGRSLARYPIFWGLDKIGSLPNPDPTDTAPLAENQVPINAQVDRNQEAKRGAFRRQAQEWAGLNIDEDVSFPNKLPCRELTSAGRTLHLRRPLVATKGY